MGYRIPVNPKHAIYGAVRAILTIGRTAQFLRDQQGDPQSIFGARAIWIWGRITSNRYPELPTCCDAFNVRHSAIWIRASLRHLPRSEPGDLRPLPCFEKECTGKPTAMARCADLCTTAEYTAVTQYPSGTQPQRKWPGQARNTSSGNWRQIPAGF